MKIEIQGQDAVNSILDFRFWILDFPLLSRRGLQILDFRLWNQKYQKSQQNLAESRIEKVLIVAPNGRRLLLQDAKVEQIQEILKN